MSALFVVKATDFDSQVEDFIKIFAHFRANPDIWPVEYFLSQSLQPQFNPVYVNGLYKPIGNYLFRATHYIPAYFAKKIVLVVPNAEQHSKKGQPFTLSRWRSLWCNNNLSFEKDNRIPYKELRQLLYERVKGGYLTDRLIQGKKPRQFKNGLQAHG